MVRGVVRGVRCAACVVRCVTNVVCGVWCGMAWPAGLRARCIAHGVVFGLCCVVWFGVVWSGVVRAASQRAGDRVAGAGRRPCEGVGNRGGHSVGLRERKLPVSPREWGHLAWYGSDKCSRHRTSELCRLSLS